MKRSDYLLIICTLAFLFIVSFQIALASAEENFFKNNARTIIALAALVVSIATVLSTILNNNRIKRQNELSILPKLLFNIKIESISEFELALNNGLPPLDHPNKITLSLINVGVGFAVVTDIQFFNKTKKETYNIGKFRNNWLKDFYDLSTVTATGHHRVIRVDKKQDLIIIGNAHADGSAFMKMLQDFEVIANYKDMYENAFEERWDFS
jgi:hypothetical protein